MYEDVQRCYRAIQSKDARFDGWFVTAVVTTGIYCRPSCPARVPNTSNVRFYPTAAAAQLAGFRACKRCRPDASPGSPEWNVRSDMVGRAMRLIGDGVVAREGVPGLAARLGYSIRQLERHLLAEVGAGPLALANAQRAQTAWLLIETTTMAFTDVAFAAGFSSVRQFNDAVRVAFATTPTELRLRARPSSISPRRGSLVLRLPFRAPLNPDSLFGHLVASMVPGLEEHRDGAYRRTLRLPRGCGVVALSPQSDHISCRLVLDDLSDLTAAIARCRRLLDLDADPQAVVASLAEDPALAPLVVKVPGRRIPRTVDEVELALRVVLGQQISMSAARTHVALLAERYGTPIVDSQGALTRVFPSAEELSEVDWSILRIPLARQRSIAALGASLAEGSIRLDAGVDWDRARERLIDLPGIGPWTAEMIAMRALGDPDAFPMTDMGVRKAATLLGLPKSHRLFGAHAHRWRPWRAYAVQYLWAELDHAMNRWPPALTSSAASRTQGRTDVERKG
ncbi:MAG: DNA-3-methyladenine glycosylase 2 family protein [Ferrimicrobium sp.]